MQREIFLAIWKWSFSICWKYFPFPIECLWSLCWKSIDYIFVSLFLDSLLFHWSVCLPVCLSIHFPNCCSFRVSLKVRLWVLKFCSIQGCLGHPECLDFPCVFQNQIISIYKEASWDCYWDSRIYNLQKPDVNNTESSNPWKW